MLTGELRNKVDKLWDTFWTGGISNPLEVIEQITYLPFIRRLDELQTLEDNRASSIPGYEPRRIFPEGKTEKGVPYAEFRWSRLKNNETSEMFGLIGDHLFPWMRELGGETSLYAKHMDRC
jgi:type I restriction enzyme M protein